MATSRSEPAPPAAPTPPAESTAPAEPTGPVELAVSGRPSALELAAVLAVLTGYVESAATVEGAATGGGRQAGVGTNSAWVGRDRIVGRVLGPPPASRWGRVGRRV